MTREPQGVRRSRHFCPVTSELPRVAQCDAACRLRHDIQGRFGKQISERGHGLIAMPARPEDTHADHEARRGERRPRKIFHQRDGSGLVTLIVHCLAQRPRSLGWIVRVDGQPDVLLPSEYLAVEYGRTVSMSLANRYRVPASLRVWQRLGPFVSEEIRPSMEQEIAVNRVRRQGRG